MPNRSLRNLDLNLMVIFEAIFSSGSIGSASENLNLSQPAVSNALSRLRQLTDDPLFVRNGRRVEPTQKARQMIAPIRDALKLIGSQLAPGTLDLQTYERHFRVIISDPLESMMMAQVVQTLIRAKSKITLECMSGFRTDFVNELIDGTIDLACYIFPAENAEIVTVPIAPIDIVVVARRGHPAFRKKITAQEFAGLHHVMLQPEIRKSLHVEQSFQASGTQRRALYTVNKLWSFAPLIEETDLVGTLPRWYAEKIRKNFDIEIHDPPNELPEQHAYMTWHKRSQHDPGHMWLREQLLKAFHDALATTGAGRVIRLPRRQTTKTAAND